MSNNFTPAQLPLGLPGPLAARQSLFLSTNGQPYTTSRAVAERFGKQHKNVLRDIEKTLVDLPDIEFGRLNFEPSSYLNEQRKSQPEYRLTHDGFALLAMGFTGRDALAWKVAFLQAFNNLEAEVHRLHTAKAHALDMLRPNLQAVIDGERVGANRALLARYMGKTVGSVTYHRCVARRLGLIGQRQGAQA